MIRRVLLAILLLASSTIDLSVLQAQFIPDELLVKFKPGTQRAVVLEVNTEIGALVIGTSLGDPDLYRVQLRPGLDLEKAINRYETNPNVMRASKNLLTGIPEDRGDGFDDIAEGSRFFSQTPARLRWAAAQNARCDLLVRRPGIGPDRVVETLFFDRAGNGSSNWSLGSLKTAPVTDFSVVSMQVGTTDGSAFFGKTGRIGVGFIGRTGLTNRTCPLTGLPYDENSFVASVLAGVQLDDARPFWHTDPPYTERTRPPIAIADLNAITISIGLTDGVLTLRISNPDTGAVIFSVTESLPLWNWSGIRTPVFAHYGVADGTSGALYVRWFSAQ